MAGAAGGMTLANVPGTATRPTTDRVKEALFSRLESYDVIHDAVVLDLFAGSGAVGAECASRGAARVELVEHLGSETFVYARAGKGDLITIAMHNDRGLAIGQPLPARFDPARVLLFGADEQRIR